MRCCLTASSKGPDMYPLLEAEVRIGGEHVNIKPGWLYHHPMEVCAPQRPCEYDRSRADAGRCRGTHVYTLDINIARVHSSHSAGVFPKKRENWGCGPSWFLLRWRAPSIVHRTQLHGVNEAEVWNDRGRQCSSWRHLNRRRNNTVP